MVQVTEDSAGGTFKTTLKVCGKFNKKDIEISRILEVTVFKPNRIGL